MTGSTFKRFVGVQAWLAAALVLFAGAANAAWDINLQEPVTSVARRIYELHTFLTWLIFAIFVGVFSVVTYSLIMHTRKRGHKAATFHDNTTIEIVWTVIPVIILVSIAFPATRL